MLCINYFNSFLGQRWSQTHGFFVVMGGFHLFERNSEKESDVQRMSQEDDEPLRPLLASDLTHDNIYSFTMLTEAEIKDKGKSDWFTKSLVLLQTSWFVMQCIARAIEHLPVTHLEIITLAYATMNFVIYIFWWNKPLNVNRPVRVFRKSEPRETQTQARKLIPEAWKLTWEATVNGLRTILCFIVGKQDEDVNLSHKDRVPMFWANSAGEQEIADVIVLGVGVCFGAIHCIAWNFSFPTHTEVLIWRISSVTITAVPMFIPLMLLLGTLVNRTDFTVTDVISTFLAGILYILARLVTLVLAFTSLRDLQPGVYETVHWTTFIPHV